MKYFCTLIFAVVFHPGACIAQTAMQDLSKNVSSAKSDTQRARIYLDIAKYYLNKNSDSAILFSDKSLALARKLNDARTEALAYMNKGVALVNKGKYDRALQCDFASLRICDKTGMKGLIANVYNDIAIVYTHANDFAISLEYYKKALAVKQDKGDPDSLPVFKVLLNVAAVYTKKGEYDSSNLYNRQALAISRRVRDSLGTAILLFNIGDNFNNENKPSKALPYLMESKAVSEKINDAEGVAYCNNALGISYQKLQQYQKSIYYTNLSLQQSKAAGMYEIEHAAYNTQYINYYNTKNYKQAIYYRNLEIAINDSLNSLAKDQLIKKIKDNYEIEKEQQQINLLLKKDENNNLKRRIILFVALFIAVLLVLALFAYARIRKLKKELERQNAEMQVQNNTLQELNETKNKLFSIIGHDLKGPFSSVKGLLELMKDNHITEEESKQFFTKLYQGFNETSQMLNKLLEWANFQMRGWDAKAAPFNVWQVINTNISLIEIRANAKKIYVETNETALPVTVCADVNMIDIIVRNLLENAVKFSNTNGVIKIVAVQERSFVKVSITDNGKGMGPEAKLKLFNKAVFYTTRGTAGEKGTGLGLHIARELVEKNGGKIWVESQPNEGSTFYFTVPLA